MSFWQNLLSNLGFHPAGDPTPPASQKLRPYYNDEDILQAVRTLAAWEQRSEEEVTNELLASALAQRAAIQETYRRWQTLTPREQEVVLLVRQGMTNRQIAARLHVSAETIKVHMTHALNKFDLHSRNELCMLLSDWDFNR
jgi:DNA-binding NarL/FixJ family response regulator